MPTTQDGFPGGCAFIKHIEVSRLCMCPFLAEYINIIALCKHVMWAEYYRALQSDTIPASCKHRLTSAVSPPAISVTPKPNHMLGYEESYEGRKEKEST